VLALGLATAQPPLPLFSIILIATPLADWHYFPVVVAAPLYLALGAHRVARRLDEDVVGWAWLSDCGPIHWTRPLRFGRVDEGSAPPSRRRFIETWQLPGLLWMLLLPIDCLAMFGGALAFGRVRPQTLILGAAWTVLSFVVPTRFGLGRS
jgi:hypothetical protein